MSCIQRLEIAPPTSSRQAFGAGLLLAVLLLGASPPASQAQGTFRAAVLNVPPVLSSPYVSDIEQNVRQGRYAVQLTYSNATGDPVRARLRLTVRHEGEQVLQTTSQPATFQPGTYTYRTFEELPELTFEESAGDLVDQLRERLGNKIARSGVLPEGQYTIEARPLLADPAAPVSPVPGTAVTTVRFPQPPELISPADQSTITVEQPVFSWTPVNGTGGDVFEYKLLIAKVLPNQTPLQAIEANRLATGQEPIALRQQTSFPYTQELPPLEKGATYAWQVRAQETTQGVPLSDEGESEIYTFTYGSPEAQYEAPELVAPVDEAVPDISALRFQWYEAEGPRASENEDYRELYQRLIVAQKQEGQSPESALEKELALEETYPFEGGDLRDVSYPTDTAPLSEGEYAWTVQLVGETGEDEEVLASSRAASFSVTSEEQAPPVASGERIRLTPFASLVGTDNLSQTDGLYNGQAQMALALIGQDQPLRVPAQVKKLKATPNDAGTLVAQEGQVLSQQVQQSMPLGQVPGFDLEALHWDNQADAIKADARLTPNGPFSCTDPSIDLPEKALTVLPNGALEGTVSVESTCPIDVGPFQATPTHTTLHFSQTNGEQTARLESEAKLEVSSSVSVTGTLAINLMTGEFQALNFEIDQPFEWGVPTNDPVLTFRINRAKVGLSGLEIDGRNRLLLPGGSSVRATFDNLTIGLNQPSIKSGRVVFDKAFAFEVGMDQNGQNLTYRTVSTGASLSKNPGVLFALAGTIVLDKTGLHSSGTASGQLAFGQWTPSQSLQADFSNNFAIGLAPFGIRRGQVDLSFQGTSIGYIDKNGFHPNSAQLTAQLPAKLPLPSKQVAYLRLKQNGTPVVSLSQQSGGTALLQTKPGKTLDLVIPGLQGTPTISAQIKNLRVKTTGGFDYQSGTVTATVSGGPIDLTKQGVPLYLTEASYGQVNTGNASRTGLFLKGNLALFGEDTGSDGQIRLAMDASGSVSGSVSLSNLSEQIDLAGGGKARLTVNSVNGSINAPASGSPSYTLTLGSTFALQDGGTTAASADLGLRLTEQRVTVQQFSASSNLQTPPLRVGGFQLDVNGVSSLKTFTYSQQKGFGFRLGLDLTLGLESPSSKTFTVPFKGVEIFRNAKTGNAGFDLPAQAVHGSTKPALDDQQTLTVGPVELRLINADLKKDVTFDWFNAPQSIAQALSALKLDLGVRIDAYSNLAGKELSIYDASFFGGVFTGQLKSFSFQQGQEPTIGLGGTAGLSVQKISGGLTNDGTPQNPTQGFDIDLDGQFDLPDIFTAGGPPNCPPMDVSATLTSKGGLQGSVSNFAACGNMQFGPATLTFPSSTLKLAVDTNGEQSATLDGQAKATIEGINNNTLSASGTAKLDLIEGKLLSSSIAFSGTFDYGLPKQDPVFTFRVQQARLGAAGLAFTGNGSLRTNQGQQVAGVAFNQLTVHPDSGIVSGSATLQSTFGLEVGLQQGQVNWKVIQPSASTSSSPALRITMPANLTIDKSGLTVGGSSTASLNFNQNTYASLSANFKSFQLNLDPVDVESGRVEFTTQGGTRVAYYNSSGFHFDAGGVTIASLPKKLGLPKAQIAYLQLRDDQGNPLVQYQSASGGGHQLFSTTDANGNPKPITLVLASVGSQGNHPTFEVKIPQSNPLVVNDAFQKVKSGKITVSVDEPLRTNYDLPLRLTKLVYDKKQSGTYALTADGKIDLPEGLGGEQASFRDLGFGTGGPRGTIEAGTYTGGGTVTGTCKDVPSTMPSQPIASAAYSNQSLQPNPSSQQLKNSDLGVRLQGVEFAFSSSGSHTFALIGDATSRVLTNTSASKKLPDHIAFTAGYTSGTWTANLCTGMLPSDKNGDKKVSLGLAELYLNDQVGAGIGLEVGPNTMNLMLSGTARFPDLLGGSFSATVKNLKMGTVGITVAKAQAATGGQSFTLLNGELKLETPPKGFSVQWDPNKKDLVLSMSGKLWLTAFMDPAKPSDAVQFNNLTVSTSGDVNLGSASANLLPSKLAVIGSKPDPKLSLDKLLLKKPKGQAALAATIGGTTSLPDLMNGVSSDYEATIDSKGQVTTDSPLRARFVNPSGPNDPVDKIGDNSKTEIDFGDVATMDVKEVGVAFNGGQISKPTVYANGAAYVQPEGNSVDDLVRFGSLGAKDASNAGLYFAAGQAPSFNPSAQVDDFDLFGFLTLSDMSVSVTQEGGMRKVVLGGKISANLDGVGGASGRWKDLKISRDGIKKGDEGRLDGGLSLTIAQVVDLSLNSLDYGSGQFSHGDSTVTADKYFKLKGAGLTLADVGKGNVGAAYYYVTPGGKKAIELYGGTIKLGKMTKADASFIYHKKDGAMTLFAAGVATFGGEQLTVAGAFEDNGSGNIRYGLFASLKSTTGVPIAPGVTVTGIGGGFFYRPKSDWIDTIKDKALGSKKNLLPKKPKYSNSSSLTFAAFLYTSANVGQIAAQVLIEGTNQHTSLYATGNVIGMEKFMGAGLHLSIYYGQRAGMEGGALVDVTQPPTAWGKATVNFAAYENQKSSGPPLLWFIKGQIGTSQRKFQVYAYQASGKFFVGNDGLLLEKLSVRIGTPNLGVVNISAGATVSFWHIPQQALGAYAKIGVKASLFNGAARLGANLKGAYIREDNLIYAAAEAYVEVVGVFKGNVGLWAAIEDGNVRGGKGSNERYESMVADAQAQAKRMIAKAQQAQKKMNELKQQPIQVSAAALKEAGKNAVLPEPPTINQGEAQQILSNLKGAETKLPLGPALSDLTYALDNLVNANDKPSPSKAKNVLQTAKEQRRYANNQADAVSKHLKNLKTKQIKWTNQASQILQKMDMGSPVSDVQSAQYSGSGKNQRLTKAPSWQVDQQKADQQSKNMADLKKSIDELNEQYKKSIAAVQDNIEQADSLFNTGITFAVDNRAGELQTSINRLAGLYADAERNTRKYYAERADYLWDLGGWAAAERATLQSKRGLITGALSSGIPSNITPSLANTIGNVNMARYDAFKKLAPTTNQLPSRRRFKKNKSQSLQAYKRWGQRLWYDIFDKGLQAIEKDAEQEAKSLSASMYKATGSDAHEQFTKQVDAAYNAKQQLLTTYYGMIRSYRAWREDAGLKEESEVTGLGLKARLDSLERVLRPPTINSVSVTRSHTGWKAQADVSVSASHPEGVPEISYNVYRGTGYILSMAGPFYSIGDKTSFTLHTFAEKRNQKTQDFAIGVRARGPGGATLRRQATVTLAVNKQGENTAPDGTVTDAMPDDNTPPKNLNVDFPRLPTAPAQVQAGAQSSGNQGAQQSGNNSGSNTVSISTLQGSQTYIATVSIPGHWTNSSSVLRMKLYALDEESDIAGYDYKIGTSKGAGDVRGWTAAQGEEMTFWTQNRTRAETGLKATVRGLDLKEGTPYYVTVRARNGAGLKTVHEYKSPIVYDGTPPGTPGEPGLNATTRRPSWPSYGTLFGLGYRAVDSPPSWTGMPEDAGTPTRPTLKARWKAASDDGSGIMKYEYVVTRDNPDHPFQPFGGDTGEVGNSTSETITGDWLSYVDSTRVHIRAVDNARNKGEPLTLGPFLPDDASPPNAPEVHPMVVPDGVRLYFTTPAYDLESGIKGYQYEVRNANTQNVVKSYPSDASVEIEPQCPQPSSKYAVAVTILGASQATSRPGPGKWTPDNDPMGCKPDSDVNTAPYFFISNSEVPTGVPLTIRVKPVNGQNVQGAEAYTARVTLDDSAPTVSASAGSGPNSSDVHVTIDNAHDPESGIAKVEHSGAFSGWTEVTSHASPPNTSRSYSFTISGMPRVNNQDPKAVSVRVTNGAGHQTVKTVMINKTVSKTGTNWTKGNLGSF